MRKKTSPKKKPSKKKPSKKTAANISVMKRRGAYRGAGNKPTKKKTAGKKKSARSGSALRPETQHQRKTLQGRTTREKPSKANAKVMKLRGAHPFEDKTGAPRSTPIPDTDLSSFWSINGTLKWIAEALLSGEITPEIANQLRMILSAAAENQKKRLQEHGKWVEHKKEELVVISAELNKCLEQVQGSSTADLKKIQGQVSAIMGGLRE